MAIARSDNKPLVLYPARISLATNDVISDPLPPAGVPVQGVPLGIFRDVTRANGTLAAAVKVLVDPPLDTGDYVEITLWLNGTQTGLPQSVVDEVMTFDLFQSDLRDGSINIIQYKLENHAGNVSESTELWALYSATLPGGNNVPGTGDHPALAISLPAELGDPASIGKDEVDRGVLLTFDYPYRKAHDKITYEINRERFSHTVKPDEVAKPFSVLIERPQFELVGSLENCPFSYTVVDQLLNATHNRRWSTSIFANVNLEGVILPMPLLREKAADNTDDPNIVDLKKLDGGPLLAVVLPNHSLYQIGDWVTAYYQLDDSSEKASEPGAFPADDFGSLDPCIVYIPNDQLISGKSLRVRFVVERPKGTVIGTSRTAKAEIIGEAVPDLAPPTIKQATGTSLDPFAAKDTLTAIVPAYNDMIGTQVSVTWTGTSGEGSITVGPVNVTAQMDKEITLPNTVVAFNLGKTVKVIYTVIRNGVPRNSKELVLNVLAIADGDSRLPTPNIAGVTDELLETNNLSTDSRILSVKIPLQQALQPLWISLMGFDGNGNPITKVIRTGEPNQSADGFSEPAPVDWLKQLKNGTALQVECAINLDGIKDKLTAVSLPGRTYKVSAFIEARPIIVNIKDSIRDNIPEGGTTADTAVTLSGTASAGQNIQLYEDSSPIGPVIKVETDGNWSQLIDGLTLRPYAFTASAKYGAGLTSTPPRILRVMDHAEENLDDLSNQCVKLGQSIETPLMSIVPHDAFSTVCIAPALNSSPGKIDGKVISISTMGGANFRLDLKSTYKRISFWASTDNGDFLQSLTLLQDQYPVAIKNYQPSRIPSTKLFEISASGGFNAILVVWYTGSAYSYQLDHIRLYK